MTSRVHSFETELLTQDKNLTGLAAINRELLARVEAMESSRRVVLDMRPFRCWRSQDGQNGLFWDPRWRKLGWNLPIRGV